MEEKQDRYTIQSIDKALDLLELLAERGPFSLIELAELLNQPKSSTYRIVLTLENRGYVSRIGEDGKYCLGYRQLVLTRNLLEQSSFRGAASHEMKKLSDLYGDTVNLGVLFEGDILYVDIIESRHALRMTDTVGSRSPFHATAMGKAIAAHMPEAAVRELLDRCGLPPVTDRTLTDADAFLAELANVRRLGYAVDDQEIVEGARCVAAPVFGMFGVVQGAISLSGAMHRYSDAAIPGIAQEVRAAADAVSRRLGHVAGAAGAAGTSGTPGTPGTADVAGSPNR